MFGWSGTKRRERGGETRRLQCRERVAQRIARTVRTFTRLRFERRSGLSNGKTAHRVASSSSSFVTGGRRGQQQRRVVVGRGEIETRLAAAMDHQRLTLLKRKLEALNYDGELDTKSAPLAEKVRRRAERPRNENAMRARTSPSARRDFKFRLRSGDSPRARARHARPHARRPNRHARRESLRVADPTPSLAKRRP